MSGRTFADMSPDLLDAVTHWRDQDPDPVTVEEIDQLIRTGDIAGIEERFVGRLEFGTAGLRGELGAGPMRMNRVLVAQAAGGLAAHLGAGASIVIGYDGRHNSAVFARDTAEIMAGAGIRTQLMPRMLPTPVLAFAVRHLGASAGVMVTASHNPARDNGYKVYLGGADGGSQIVPPADALIAARIAAIDDIRELPRSDEYASVAEDVVDAYVAATASVGELLPRSSSAGATFAPSGAKGGLRYVYTAMHGVGFETATRVFAAAGFSAPISVAEQQQPDPDFPTVAFPNPEEPGALDLAISLASTHAAELIVANDPDADRLAIAVPEHSHLDPSATVGWRRMSGNEVGALLGWAAARRLHGSGRSLAASVVSSPALREIAESFDLPYVETLTGFKWISRADALGYGYEEALGYLVNPDTVRDKDGISAAVAFLSLVAELKAGGTTLEEHQREFDEEFGAFASGQISIRVANTAPIMQRLRTDPPGHIGRIRVVGVDDFADGLGELPPSDIVRFRLEHGARVIVRPSGTEPKLKVYLDASSTDGTVDERRRSAADQVADLDRGMRHLMS